jgi:hypothetical protein
MKWLTLPIFGLALLFGSTALAQQTPSKNIKTDEVSPSDISPTLTPEIWLYMQELRRYDDPKQAVRRKAEFRAQQRLNRLAAMRWYGVSNQRPLVFSSPWTSDYSPVWPGYGWNRYFWINSVHPWTASYSSFSNTFSY